MRSSDTPETDPELAGPQGPADWWQELPSDDRLSPEVRRRLEQLRHRDEQAKARAPTPRPSRD